MDDWTKWILGIAAFLLCAAIVAVAKLVAGKANKTDLDEVLRRINKEKEEEHKELRDESRNRAGEVNKKFEELQAEGLRQYRELRTSIEVVQKEITLLDKHSLTSNDLLEMKSDIKELVKGNAESLKLIDGMPERLKSLEATRNKQSER